MRTIRVTGKGQLKVHPDRTRIVMTLTGLHRDYEKTLRRSSEDTEQLRKTLAPFRFEPADLKTLSFDIEPENESYKEKDVWKNRFTGYKFEHVLKVEFPSDNKRLGKILYALAHSPLNPEFRIIYFAGEPEAAKNELLGRAVVDAKTKAAVLTAAAGVFLKEIQSVDYSWGEINLEYSPVNRAKLMDLPVNGSAGASCSYDMNMESSCKRIRWSILQL